MDLQAKYASLSMELGDVVYKLKFLKRKKQHILQQLKILDAVAGAANASEAANGSKTQEPPPKKSTE